MDKQEIVFFPVDNGDNVLVKYEEGKVMQVDCKLSEADTKENLLADVNYDTEHRPYVDVFVSSHSHDDHATGFSENYYCGNPDDYDDADNKIILIGELWVTHDLLSNETNGNGIAIRKEAKRRFKMFEKQEDGWQKFGNRLQIIGKTKGKEKYDDLVVSPGEIVTNFCGLESQTFAVAILNPSEAMSEAAKDEKNPNLASIVMQLQFKDTQGVIQSRIILAGDAEHQVFDDIQSSSIDEEYMKWDLLLAPHHCSWTFFNDTPQDENPEVLQSALDFLNRAEEGAYVIASSKEVKNDDDNPPHYDAMKQYKNKCGASNFVQVAKSTDRLIVKVTNNGLTIDKPNSTSNQGTLGTTQSRAGANGRV